ncbi:serine/threonine protein kinase, putative [Plasmodium relictum]|uniref:Serine/threonine protein kinase, putative n=1 Tax=Plasmodium relictum TaxID=85471 RepID=A0A1J1HAF8_PLARL|nr:serine/threonine protein kinase, putative [Plasmodium relictum]CRH01496.1 serine/threonine protein kinase, putative [Plasmodium relictum]
MQRTEKKKFSLFEIVEDFNSKCTYYKNKNITNFMFSNNASTKNSSNNDERKEFLQIFNDFIRRLNNLHRDFLEYNNTYENYENLDISYNEDKNINYIDNEENKDISDTEYSIEKNLNNEKKIKESSTRNINENERMVEEKKRTKSIDMEKIKLINNSNINDLLKNDKKCSLQISEECHTDFSSESSFTNTNESSENEDAANKINDTLIKYVIDLDYALNIRRISKENLIEEIKEFYSIHNNNIRLNDYSKYLSYEIINILKKKIDEDNFNFINRYENPFKNNKFFFNIPHNYFFIKNYSDQNKEILYKSNNTNYEKSLNGVNTHALSYNSSSVNGNTYNLCANSILSRNNSYNKFSSPNFGSLERHLSPNFGSFDENNNNEDFNFKDENKFHKNYEYEEEKCNNFFKYNSNNEPIDNNNVLTKHSTTPSSKNMNTSNSPDYSRNYNNEDELTKNLNDRTELENDHIYEINNTENKKNNLSSNTSDFYQSISDFYKNKENYNCDENNSTYIRKSSLFLNSNETDINSNNKNSHENRENIINLCFDDELSSAITLNNDSSSNKDKKNYYPSEKDNDIINYKTDRSNRNIYDEKDKKYMEKLGEYEKDESRWFEEYCNGDYNLFRSKQLKKKKEIMIHYLNSLSNNNKKNEELGENDINKIGNIYYNNGNTNLDSENNYDNMYNVINLKVIYENNKCEFGSNEEISFFPNQIILNKYQVLKILSKTKFSTTLKCLNLHYKKDRKHKKRCPISTDINDKENIHRSFDENISISLRNLKNGKNINNFNEYIKKENYDSKKNFLRNNINRRKEYKYVCLKVMKNGKSFLDQGLFELIVLNLLCNENKINDKNNDELTNKNIIQLYDYFYFKEHLIIVTEYMQSDLYNYFIKKGKIGTIGQLQVLAKNLLEGIAYIHSKNLIHCDLKPENIMINMRKRKSGKQQQKKSREDINVKEINYYNSKNFKDLKITKNDSLEHGLHIYNNNQDNFLPSSNKNNLDNVDNFNSYNAHNKLSNNLDICHKDLKNPNDVNKYYIDSNEFSNYSNKLSNDLYSQGNNSNNSDNLHIFSNEKFDKIKIIDFNSAIYESDKLEMYVQTRSYRSPEVLLQQNYDRKIDIWSLGCVLFEFLTKKILFDHQNIYRFIYSIVSYIGHFPFYMIYECKIPYIFTKHGLIILKKFVLDKNYENYVKEKQIDEIDDQEVIFNSKDFFRLNKKGDFENDILQRKQDTEVSSKQKNQEVFYDVCYPSDNLLKNNFHIGDILFIDFLLSLLQIDPCKRLDSTQALKHPWLTPNMYEDGL